MSGTSLRLMLFAHESPVLRDSVAAGIREFMVDCEWIGKEGRQNGFDTDTTHQPLSAVAAAATVPGAVVNCRINHFGAWTAGEVDAAVAAGAQRVFLPMVRSVAEVASFLRLLDDRALPAILLETAEAVALARDLAGLPLDAVYVGLNDLAISRGTPVIFQSLLDGTVEHLREVFADVDFGFGGVTLLGFGAPCPSRLLLAEMQRLQCGFSFLRRSYWRDVAGRNAAEEVARIGAFWQALSQRSAEALREDKRRLDDLVRHLVAQGTLRDVHVK